MRSQRQRRAIDPVARVTQQIQMAWADGKLADMLLMDVKGAFHHVSKNGLMQKIEMLGVNRDLIMWTGSFLSEMRISLVVDSHKYKAVEVERVVPQRSSISPILFAVYISRIFKVVEKEVERCTTTWFADDCG